MKHPWFGDREQAQDILQFGSGRLLADLIDYARLGRPGRPKGSGAKIIFIGDPAQLPPVGKTVLSSLVFRLPTATFRPALRGV